MPQEARAEEVRRERREKLGKTNYDGDLKLSVDESRLNRDKFQYRWVNDKGNRVQRLDATKDWEIAPEGAKENTSSLGTVSSTHAGVEEGRPYGAVLMRKHKDWFEESQRAKQRPLDEVERAIMRGRGAAATNELAAQGGEIYTPGTGNKIERA